VEEPVRRAYVVDDDKEIRIALNLELRAAGIECRPFASAGDFLAEVEHLHPGCILLDVRMPQTSGVELLAELALREIRWPAIMLTGHAEVMTAVEAMKRGAIEFLEKPFSEVALMGALDSGFEKLSAALRRSGARRSAMDAVARLSPRESEMLGFVAEGLSSREIAASLQLSQRTVEMHRGNMMRKLGVSSMLDAVRIAEAAGLGQSEE
jgi:two-component system response regulator FixJ